MKFSVLTDSCVQLTVLQIGKERKQASVDRLKERKRKIEEGKKSGK